MVRLFVVLLAIVLMTGTASAAGLRMAPNDIRDDSSAARILGDRIQESLARDSSGHGVIQGHPCATPNDYFVAIRTYHPSASLGSVAELPNYLRQLKYERNAAPGTFPMSRILQNGSSCKLDLAGWTRAFHSGEGSWRDPNTGEIILAGDCGNVVGGVPPAPPPQRHVEECVEIPVMVLRSHLDRTTVQMTIRPTLYVWGPVVAGCGLTITTCVCIDPATGRAGIAFNAPPITGSGMVRMPRAWLTLLEKLCFVSDTAWPQVGSGQAVLISKTLIERYMLPIANAGERVVVPTGFSINFFPTPQPIQMARID